MDTAPRAALRRPELVTDIEVPPAAPEPARALIVMAVYALSEAGRKASLLAGGDGHALQQLKVQVPTSRLHLVTVDPQGTARLKLRPRFELNSEHGVVRTDAVPTYDAPPTLEDLFREAARNHELERVYQAERHAARTKRREAERERRSQIAQAFLADKSQRALVHPAPSPRRCTLVADQGRVLFDVATDEGVARDVPAEAHRRFRADLAARKEKNLRERAAQLALHEEKKRFIAEWIEKHGTTNQRERQAVGMLGMDEAIEAIADHTFAQLSDIPLYRRDGIERLQNAIRTVTGDMDFVLSLDEVLIESMNAQAASADQWAFLCLLQDLIPQARATLRVHTLRWKRDKRFPPLTFVAAVLATRVGPFQLRREYSFKRDVTRSIALP